MHRPIEVPPAVLERLAPDYREFIDSTEQKTLALEPWSPEFRQPSLDSPTDKGMMSPIPVGSHRSIELENFSVKVMTPEGEVPTQGWPVVLFIHGGGWVFGDASMEDGMLSRICMDITCVIVSVEYRLAPEHPFPAGLNDCWSALRWLHAQGKEQLGIDPKRVALMGNSAGGNLVAVLAQRASLASPRIPLVLQILIVPALDLSLTPTDRSRWTPSLIEHEHNFSLPTTQIFWFRDLYLPRVKDRTEPDASPIYQTNNTAFESMPPAWIGVGELDPLKSEGEMYAEKLRGFGVPVTLRVMKGLTHGGAVADRVCEEARMVRSEQIKSLKDAFA